MKKILLLFLSSIFIFSPTLTTISCKNVDESLSYCDPNWIYQMKTEENEEFAVGYNNYYLPTASSTFQQKDWLDLNQEAHIYLYFKNVVSLDEVMQKLQFGDTAHMQDVTHLY
ncbi:MAG: hypothetical protein SPLM_08220 [Spiroplasma phoeniceum]